MKKRLLGILLVCCMVAAGGCGNKKNSVPKQKNDINENVGQDVFPLLPTAQANTDSEESNEVLTNEGDSEQEAAIRYELAAMLPFTEGDDKICAIAYMGNSGAVQEENLIAFYETYFPTLESSSWESLPTVICGGSECYLVIPRYKDTVTSVNVMGMTEEGKIKVTDSEVVEEEAFLVYCNALPEYANAEVNLSYGDGQFVVVPRLSAVDGRIEQTQVALDLTMEQVYQ